MLISHKHRFIFIRTRKTASTSIETALSRFAGPDDVVTTFCERDEIFRRQYGGVSPQNFSGIYYNHMPAEEVMTYVGEKIWNEYLTFCFERNPWDKIVSYYYHKTMNLHNPKFSQFLYSPMSLRVHNFPLYSKNGKPMVKYIFKYEELESAISTIQRLTGIAIAEIPRIKANFRPKNIKYSQFYSKNDIEYVADLFADEISQFNYVF